MATPRPSGLTSSNYTLTFNTGLLAITKASLFITADNKSKIHGTIDPGFTASYAGFVSGETPTVLGGTLSFVRTTGAPTILPLTVTTSNVVITWTAVSNANYRVQFKPVLTATSWTDLAGDVQASGGTALKTDIKTTTNRFYRIQVLP